MRATPLARGVLRAFAAAVLFGSTAPLLQRASAEAGPLASGALLYLGAALASFLAISFRGGSQREARLPASSFPRLALVALAGGMIAPALLVLGLQRTDAATSSLVLALEAPSTLLLARLVFREHLGARAVAATGLIFAGGALLAGRPGAGLHLSGALLVAGAAIFWALDNVLSRPLADRDPIAVVAGKGLLGGLAGALAAGALGDRWPAPRDAAALLAIGGLGYGASLQLYLRAQRTMGAARTASVFAVAPFLGVAAALLFGAPWPGLSFAAAAALIGAGLILHVSEKHAHRHAHSAIEHEHAHTHDDGHHDHLHQRMPPGPHAHLHRHEPLVHEHAHAEDQHHRHEH